MKKFYYITWVTKNKVRQIKINLKIYELFYQSLYVISTE